MLFHPCGGLCLLVNLRNVFLAIYMPNVVDIRASPLRQLDASRTLGYPPLAVTNRANSCRVNSQLRQHPLLRTMM